MASSARSYLITLLLYVSVVNEISLPLVTCQDDEGEQCLPRKTFFALLRLPEVSSNLAAYSRTARIILDAKNRNELVNLKTTSTDDAEDGEVCLPVGVYLELFSYPATRGRLAAITSAQRLFEEPATSRMDVADEEEEEDEVDSEKRSIATLAKNGDLPISIQDKADEEEEDQEKRSPATILGRDELEELYRYSELGKRNVAALARDFALPSGKRNVATLARDFALPPSSSGKRNVAALARDFALPSGKRNVAALARDFALPSGKRNIAALARDYNLPYGKRYLDIFSRGSAPRFQPSYGEKRSLVALVRNGDMPVGLKRNIAALNRGWTLPTQNRFGRSLDALEDRTKSRMSDAPRPEVQRNREEDANERKLEALASSAPVVAKISEGNGKLKLNTDVTNKNKSAKNAQHGGEKRPKRQIEFSDEYPLPVMQNNNVLDYEEIIEALAGDYPNTEKRFMATDPTEMKESDEANFYVSQPSKKHIGALARLGWLPSFRSARFSRSPRYLVNRANSADGTSADYPADSASRTLGFGGATRYSRSQNFGDCRHGFKRFLLLPAVDKLLLQKLYTTPRTA
ncbi:neuropeptide-like 1 isoform X1 [Diprion similis]|uniref:neuropeptide-like 1 isoform X1 n=1 Tax=Diprion similis TaxID=362088 RepID=UPI001EF95CBF|nr:neuropeptide-like 1 isoform X1 [Diprion similis]